MRTYSLKKQRGIPLYEALYRAIREDILSGKLQPGEKLPSKRTLAENLELGKSTVEAAYSQLLDEGYIVSREKVGYFVENMQLRRWKTTEKVAFSEPQAALKVDLTANGTGHFPFTVWNKLQREVLLDFDKKLLSPLPNFGAMELRQAIAAHLADFRGMQVDPENILIGAGTDFLYNIIVQLLGRSRVFAVEDPGYSKIRSIYTAGGARCCSIPVETYQLPGEASVAHTSPSHQFPTGMVMPLGRRKELVQWVNVADRYIIEDDFDSEFRLSGHPRPALQSMAPERVIYMNSFSKSLAPSIRISFLVLPEHLTAQFRKYLNFYSCTVPSFEQYTLSRFLSRGYFEKHINRMRKFYAARRSGILQQLAKCSLADRLTVMEQEAGLHFLLEIDTKLSDDALVAAMAGMGVRVQMLSQYYADAQDAPPHRMVVNYSGLEEEQLEQALTALEQCLRSA